MFWDGLKAEDRAALIEAGTRRSYDSGHVIFHEGAEPSFVLVILEGRVKLTTTSIDGRELILELRGAGELIGEMGVVDDAPRSAAAIVVDPVEAIVLSSAALRDVLARRGEIALGILTMVAERLRQSVGRRLEEGTSDVFARLCGRLVELAEDVDHDGDGPIVLTAPLTQQELADWIGVSRDAVVLALRQLRDEHWIETGRKRIVIHDIDALRAAAV